MIWAIHAVDKPNSTELRMSLRPAHLDYLKAQDRLIVLAGATLTDDGGAMTGSLFVIDAPDRAAAQAFSAADPFTIANRNSSQPSESPCITQIAPTTPAFQSPHADANHTAIRPSASG